MPHYTVAITEIIEYLVPVEADNEEQAAELGEKLLTDSADRDKWVVNCRARECEGVNLEPTPPAFTYER